MTQEEEQKGKAGETQGKGSQMYRGRQKLNKFNWRPCFKQRGLFSDRDPSLEIELEKRLIEAVRVAQLVPQQELLYISALTRRSVQPNNVHDAALQSIYVQTLIGPQAEVGLFAEIVLIFHVWLCGGEVFSIELFYLLYFIRLSQQYQVAVPRLTKPGNRELWFCK